MKIRDAVNKIEPSLFYICLAFNLWIALFLYVPFCDGTAHMYYAKVIQYLLSGNTFMQQHFVFNKIPVPNITDHLLLALFDWVVPPIISVKILVAIYFVGFPLAFRRIISKFNPSGKAFSIFSFPLSHNFLFFLGLYNFCLSFIVLLVCVSFYMSRFSDPGKPVRLKHLFAFLFLTLLCYFTNGLAFAFCGFITSAYLLYISFIYLRKKENHNQIRVVFFRILPLFLVWIPGLVLFWIFNSSITIQGSNSDMTLNEHFVFLYSIRLLRIYTLYESLAGVIGALLLLSLVIALYYRIKDKTAHRFLSADIFLLAFVISLVCFFVIPQWSSVGMMSERFGYYLLVFLLVWIGLQKVTFKHLWVISLFVAGTHIAFFFHDHYRPFIELNSDANAVRKAATVIKPNSVVVPINMDECWFEPYYSHYLGIDKPVVILYWYEPDMGWFVLKRNPNRPQINWLQYPKPNNAKNPDYIFLYGDIIKGLHEHHDVDSLLNKYYHAIYTGASSTGAIQVYALAQGAGAVK